MNELFLKSIFATLLVLLVTSSRANGDASYIRRGGLSIMGLFPFPRVGRADPALANTYADLHEAKRQGLIPFPRVGRSELPPLLQIDNIPSYQKRTVGNVNSGMWFGPRLGRLHKRSYDDSENPWAFVALKEPILKQNDYLTRLGKESDEENEESLVEEVLSRRLDSKNRNNVSQQ